MVRSPEVALARTREFDPSEALTEAMRLFWARGYRNTSLADLEEALGIGRKSLYNTFGDKRELFLKALDAYARKRPPVERDGAGWPEIVETFSGGGPFATEQRSCFFVNTIIELGLEQDEEIQARIERHITLLRAGFERALTCAIAAGDIPEQDVPAVALYLCSAVQGMSVMSRAGADREQLGAISRHTLAIVRGT